MSRRRRRPPRGVAHYGAPALFLLGVTIAVLLIRAGLDQNGAATSTTLGAVTRPATTQATSTAARTKQRFYTVQTGDTFGAIAAKVGISVEQLQSLNPGVSSNALQVGQKLRTR
jgi:Tfp pilus assembly protein FimV